MTEPDQPNSALVADLRSFEEEILLAVLDVALDVYTEVTLSDSQPISIEATRSYPRYRILYPAPSVRNAIRYFDLRKKGLQFLIKHHFIRSFTPVKLGMNGYEGVFQVGYSDPQKFPGLLVELRTEQTRRNPSFKAASDVSSATAQLLQLSESFHRVALRLKTRRSGREPLLIKDEYDVQYLFASLLETRFDEIRAEDPGSTHAGHSTRVDFSLANGSVVLETKMTREGLNDKNLGDALIIDIEHYKQRPDCKALVCFVYDPDHRLTNPRTLEIDLSKITDGLDVRVVIRPKS